MTGEQAGQHGAAQESPAAIQYKAQKKDALLHQELVDRVGSQEKIKQFYDKVEQYKDLREQYYKMPENTSQARTLIAKIKDAQGKLLGELYDDPVAKALEAINEEHPEILEHEEVFPWKAPRERGAVATQAATTRRE